MKNLLLIFALSMCLPAMAQVKVIKPGDSKVITKKLDPAKTGTIPVVPKKTDTNAGRTTSVLRPGKAYKINPGLASLFAGLETHVTIVDGKKIKSRMVAVNSPGLVITPNKAAGIAQKTKVTGTDSNNGQYCQSYNVQVSANSETFDVPYGTQASHIYPGAAYMYDEYYKNTVSPMHITWPRNPIYVQAASSSGSGKYELVEDPNAVTLNAATGKLKSSLPSTANNESTSINMVSIYDEADFYLKVNGGGGGFGFKADASFGIATTSKKSYFLIDAVQTFYTLNAIMPEGDTGFFKDAPHNTDKNALFMASVSYGRRVIGVLETEFTNEKTFADFKASYTSGFAGGYAGLNMINSMNAQSTKVKMYFVGGNAAPIEVPNATEESVRNSINNFMRSANSQNAGPIKFTFRNMAMSGMRYESATDNFTYRQCVPLNPALRYKITVDLMSIENSKNEDVKLWIRQWARFYVNNKLVLDPEYNIKPLLYWADNPFDAPIYNPEAPRSFKRSTNIERSSTIQVSQDDIMNGAKLELMTDYIAMYATKIFGKTNESAKKKTVNIPLKDVITSGGGGKMTEVQINFNDRVFTVRLRTTATPL